MTGHEKCAGALRDGMAPLEITVSTSPSLARTTKPFTCPHGVSYWIKPTGELAAQQAAERLPGMDSDA